MVVRYGMLMRREPFVDDGSVLMIAAKYLMFGGVIMHNRINFYFRILLMQVAPTFSAV